MLVPDEPLNLGVNQPVDLTITPRQNGTNGEGPPSPELIKERLEKLKTLQGLLPGPVIPLDALRRENLYDERA